MFSFSHFIRSCGGTRKSFQDGAVRSSVVTPVWKRSFFHQLLSVSRIFDSALYCLSQADSILILLRIYIFTECRSLLLCSFSTIFRDSLSESETTENDKKFKSKFLSFILKAYRTNMYIDTYIVFFFLYMQINIAEFLYHQTACFSDLRIFLFYKSLCHHCLCPRWST